MKDFDDMDSFWSLDDMLPTSKNTYAPARRFDTECKEIELDGTSEKTGQSINFSDWLASREEHRKSRNESVTVYEPENPLIKSVTVKKELSKQASPDRFIMNGRALFDAEGEFFGNVPFDSVFPQYALMNEEQKNCYIGFRSEVRQGRFPTVDRPYIYLYLYELINFPELLDAKEAADKIVSLMRGYPECDDKLFSDMCNWLADICLINEIELPSEIYSEIHPRVLKKARVKELFVKYNSSTEKREIYRMMAAASRYDHRSSHYYKEFSAYYDKYIENAVCYALLEISKRDSHFLPDTENLLRITCESFFGAYRTVGARYTVTLECATLTRSDEEKRTVTELTKYAENRLRSYLGIKQRLTVNYLTGDEKALIKEYFASHSSELQTVVKKRTVAPVTPQIPEYEKLYEPRSEGFTLENAAEIEERSWDITEKLVTAFDDIEQEASEEETLKTIAPVTDEIPLVIKGLKAIYNKDENGFADIARLNGMLPMALADVINEYLLDEIGDVGVEPDGDSFIIAEWYADDIKRIIEG